MTLTSESAKLLLSDPKAWRRLHNSHQSLERRKLENLTLNMMYDRDEVVNNFIAEAKAPPAANIGKFIKELTSEINFILANNGEITQEQLEELRASSAVRHDIKPDEAESIIKKHEDYYTFMLAKDDKTVVTEAEVLQAKNNITLFSTSDYMNELIKPQSYNRNKITAPVSSDADSSAAAEFFPYTVFIGGGDPSITYSKAGHDNVFCNRSHVTLFAEILSGATFRVPIDITNVYAEQKRVDYANLFMCKGSLRDAKNIVLNDYYLHVYLLTKTVRQKLPPSLRNYNHVFHLILIDENNYVGVVRLKETTIRACEERAHSDLKRLSTIRRGELYHTFPEFQRNLLYDL